MKIIGASYEILDPLNGQEILRKIERAGRVCYKSEDKITETSAEQFVMNLIKRGHESVLEHVSFSVRFIVDRGVSHELRYCNYSKDRFGKEIEVIKPRFFGGSDGAEWEEACQRAEDAYMAFLAWGYTPQQARSVLPMSLKTEVIMTANLREWRAVLRMRTSPASHPQMREVMCPLLDELKERVPIVFDDIGEEKP